MKRPRGNGRGHGGPAKGNGRGGPANGFDRRHPEFEPGNSKALKHGAFSERAVVPLLPFAREQLTLHAPWLEAVAFEPALDAAARVEAQIALVADWLERDGGPLDEEGNPKPAAEFLRKLENDAITHRTRLGLDPSSLARLQKDLGAAARDWSLAKLIEEGRRVRQERGA